MHSCPQGYKEGPIRKVILRREGDLPTWSQVGLSPTNSARLSQLEIGLSPTWDEIAQGALASQVLQSQGAAEAEENLTEKCTKCNFIPMSTKSQPSSLRRSRGLLWCLWVVLHLFRFCLIYLSLLETMACYEGQLLALVEAFYLELFGSSGKKGLSMHFYRFLFCLLLVVTPIASK